MISQEEARRLLGSAVDVNGKIIPGVYELRINGEYDDVVLSYLTKRLHMGHESAVLSTSRAFCTCVEHVEKSLSDMLWLVKNGKVVEVKRVELPEDLAFYEERYEKSKTNDMRWAAVFAKHAERRKAIYGA